MLCWRQLPTPSPRRPVSTHCLALRSVISGGSCSPAACEPVIPVTDWGTEAQRGLVTAPGHTGAPRQPAAQQSWGNHSSLAPEEMTPGGSGGSGGSGVNVYFGEPMGPSPCLAPWSQVHLVASAPDVLPLGALQVAVWRPLLQWCCPGSSVVGGVGPCQGLRAQGTGFF